MGIGRLHFLIGLARSGKSTIARSWVQNKISIRDNQIIQTGCPGLKPQYPRVIVGGDEIRLALGFRYNFYNEDFVHAIKYTMTRALLKDHDVLLDETNTTAKSIRSLLIIDPYAHFYFVDTDPQICKERARQVEQHDLLPVIDRMAENLYKLTSHNTMTEVKLYISGCITKLRKEATEIKEKYERTI